jgi:hypothetical protein
MYSTIRRANTILTNFRDLSYSNKLTKSSINKENFQVLYHATSFFSAFTWISQPVIPYAYKLFLQLFEENINLMKTRRNAEQRSLVCSFIHQWF